VIEKGKHLGLSFITHQPVKAVTIESTQTIQFHLDGEYGEANALDIRIREAAFLFRY
jgi:diacylglycerol kinase family enzyme